MRYGSSSRKAAWTPPAAFGKRFTRPSVRLDRFHVKGHRRSDLASRPLRFRRVRDYLIAYAPDEAPLPVVAVMHGSRSPRVMAAILRSRE